MSLRIDRITIGVPDIESARRFCEQGFGCAVREEGSDTFTFALGGNASEFAVRPWAAVADDAGVPDAGEGFRGYTLSYIVESADAVDVILGRAQRAGGVVSKEPKNAVWGYSAYVTDPSGCLWKVASSKRRPLFGRGDAAPATGTPAPTEVPLTIGVEDIRRAKAFYEDGVGLEVKKDYRKFVMFTGADGTSDLGMYRREALAGDAAVPADGSGFRGFSLTHVVDGRDDVDGLLARAASAGGDVIRPAASANGRGYAGCFADLDGNLWTVRAGGVIRRA